MELLGGLIEAARDWRALGASFALAGLRRRVSRGLVPVRIGPWRLWVRGGESDFHALRQTLRDKEYAVGVAAFRDQLDARYRAILRAGGRPVIVDAGANVGGASLWFASLYPEAAVLAVEPDPGNLAILHRNVGAVPNVHVLEAAIGAEPGFVALSGAGAGWATQTRRAQAGLPVITVAQAAASIADGVLFQVKVDIEGFEADLFAANTGWLDAVEAVYLEPHDWLMPGAGTSLSFQQAMARRPFAMLLKGENLIYVAHRPAAQDASRRTGGAGAAISLGGAGIAPGVAGEAGAAAIVSGPAG